MALVHWYAGIVRFFQNFHKYPWYSWFLLSWLSSSTMLKTEFSQTYHYAIPGYRMYENWFSTFQKNLVRLIWFFCKQNQTPPYNHLSGKSSSFSFGLPVSTRTSLKIFVKILSSMFMIYLGPVQAFSPLTFFLRADID